MFVLYGTEETWFVQALISYMDQKRLQYMYYEKDHIFSNSEILINCSPNEVPDSLASMVPILDLYYYMQLCYFSFPEYHNVKRNTFIAKPSHPLGMITGMSYFRDGYDTALLPTPALNLARSSQDLYYDLVELVGNYSTDMKWVVMGLAPYSLRYDEALSKTHNHRICAYISEFGQSALHNQTNLSGLITLRDNIISLLGGDIFDAIFWNGFVPIFGIEHYDMEATFDSSSVPLPEQYEVQNQYQKEYPDTIVLNKSILREYLSFCQSHKLKVLIVIPPFTDWHKAHWNPAYKDELLSFLCDLPYPFEIMDLSKDHWYDTHFRNGSHVNHKGQQYMTKLLSDWITEGATSDYESFSLSYIDIINHTIDCAKKLANFQGTQKWQPKLDSLSVSLEQALSRTCISTNTFLSAYNDMENVQAQCFQVYAVLNSQTTMTRPKRPHPFVGRGVIYTCVTGGYDNIKIPTYIDDSLDYVLFTDQKGYQSDFWQVRYIENAEQLSSVKLARKQKILAHKYLSEYDYSIYVDGKVMIIGDMKQYIETYSHGSGLLCFPHYLRDCLAEELVALIKLGKDNPDVMESQVLRYFDEGFPEHYGLTDTCILVRNHHDASLCNVMETWWNELKSGSFRDQLSFTYSCWKNNYTYDVCDLLVQDNPYAISGGH